MIAGGDIVKREIDMTKIIGIGTVTPKGTVTAIKRDGVVIVDKGAKVVLTFAEVEKMMSV
jgi:hypothetical protein